MLHAHLSDIGKEAQQYTTEQYQCTSIEEGRDKSAQGGEAAERVVDVADLRQEGVQGGLKMRQA